MRPLATCLLFILLAFQCRMACADPLSFDQARKSVWDQSKLLFGQMRENTYVPDALLSDALDEFMSMPEESRDIGDGMTMVSGCRHQSCSEKAAAIVETASGHLQAAGLRNYRCRRERNQAGAPVVCDKEANLLILLIRREARGGAQADARSRENTFVARLQDWASRYGYRGESIRTISARR